MRRLAIERDAGDNDFTFAGLVVALALRDLPREDDVFEIENGEVVIFKFLGGVGGNDMRNRGLTPISRPLFLRWNSNPCFDRKGWCAARNAGLKGKQGRDTMISINDRYTHLCAMKQDDTGGSGVVFDVPQT